MTGPGVAAEGTEPGTSEASGSPTGEESHLETQLAAHRRFLNAYYRQVRHVYDPTRKYFLFGRDRTLALLQEEPWQSLVEIGPGTGRNLAALQRTRSGASYGGVEASDAMLATARKRCAFAYLQQGYAEEVDHSAVLGYAPDRILFSYSLSMVQEPQQALANARDGVAPGGEVVVVDFGDMRTLSLLGPAMRRFLRSFHVTPPSPALLKRQGAEISWGPGRYYLIARLRS